MSKHQAIRTIRAEIGRINREIDLRIIKGAPYRREALRHKVLMAELARLAPIRSNWFGKAASFATMFLF
jgi:hypothetical protein